ncbi:MAG: DUF6152 family protein [Pseudomonadota bacterium]|nr:DUF6152 family protein [Pseudomonadota bacterium]
MTKRRHALLLTLVTTTASFAPVHAHHSFAMYDRTITYLFTGVVVSLNPDPSHLQIVFVPLNDARDALVRDAKGERVVWNVEMESAAASAQEGITASNFPRGTVFSVGLTPLRNGDPGGSRVAALFRCPQDKPPAAGQHCDSVEGFAQHGDGELPMATHEWAP